MEAKIGEQCLQCLVLSRFSCPCIPTSGPLLTPFSLLISSLSEEKSLDSEVEDLPISKVGRAVRRGPLPTKHWILTLFPWPQQ